MKVTGLLFALLLFLTGDASAACDLKVGHLSDGDTFYSNTQTTISLSVKVTESTGFRLTRVFAPERAQVGYQKAKDDLTALIGGKVVEINLPAKGRMRDKYGRFLAEVFTCQPDGSKVSVNDQQRANGWTNSGTGAPK